MSGWAKEYEVGIREGLSDLVAAVHRLGVNNAATDMGALENLAKELREGLDNVASSITYLADTIGEKR